MAPSREFLPFETHGWPFYAFACLLVLVVLRLLRIAGTRSTSAQKQDGPPTSFVSWLHGRKFDKLAKTTALSRAHTEFFHSKRDEIQAHHDLEQLVAELSPPNPPVPNSPGSAPTNTEALTLPEINDLLSLVDMDNQARADLLRLVATRIAEKRS